MSYSERWTSFSECPRKSRSGRRWTVPYWHRSVRMVPIRLVPAGAVKVDLNTRQKDAGINMLLVEVYIRIIAEVTIIIPFDTDSEIVETEVPISYLLVVGDVPMYYFDNKGKPLDDSGEGVLPPTISLPDPDANRAENERESDGAFSGDGGDARGDDDRPRLEMLPAP